MAAPSISIPHSPYSSPAASPYLAARPITPPTPKAPNAPRATSMHAAWVNGRVMIYTVHGANGQQLGYTNDQWASIASKVSPLMTRVKQTTGNSPTSITVNLTTHAITYTSGYDDDDTNIPEFVKPSEMKLKHHEFPTDQNAELVPFITALRDEVQSHKAHYTDRTNPSGEMIIQKPTPSPIADAFNALTTAIPHAQLLAYFQTFTDLQVFEKSGPDKIDNSKNAVFVYPAEAGANTRIFFYNANARTLTLFDPKCAGLAGNTMEPDAKAIQVKLRNWLRQEPALAIHEEASTLSPTDLTSQGAAHCANYVRHLYQVGGTYSIASTHIHNTRTSIAASLQSSIGTRAVPIEAHGDADVRNLGKPVALFTTALRKYGHYLSTKHANFQFVEAGGDVIPTIPTSPARRYIGTYRLVDRHFVFFLVDTQEKKLHYYDSMGKPLTEYAAQLNPVKTALEAQFADYTWSDNDGEQQQHDNHNCGAYGLHMFETVITGTPYDQFKRRQISQAEIEADRRRMASLLS
ncbi:MAG: hypothetical protein SP1CHLAM54_02650 [Chlamydiia bacterium]|nr:hypothetical protein [Chlamydiia bacterium]MCH9615181.1 hypothetical protein [Chlamydiia bacterium]MCH9628497.1 hypothetical protein [Chlamydiia bacterium]